MKRTAASEQVTGAVSQTGADTPTLPFWRNALAVCAKLFPANEDTMLGDPGMRRKFILRRALVYLVCLVVYILLDRSAVFLQIWPNISAWYPPVGLALALLIGLGPEILPC